MPNRYRDLSPTTLLSPVPVVLLSCGTQERPNAITIAWAGTVCSHPPMVSVSIRPSRYSYELIRNSGEFVVNLPDVRFAKAVDYCGVRSGRDEDKLAACGLAAVPMPGLESAPALDGFPAHLGCRVLALDGSRTNFTCYAGALWSNRGEVADAQSWHGLVRSFREGLEGAGSSSTKSAKSAMPRGR